MPVRVVLHLEKLDEGGTAWWAESPDLPAFSASDVSLQRLADLCEGVVVDEHGDDVRIKWTFALGEDTAGAPGVESASHEPNDRPERVQFVQQLVLA